MGHETHIFELIYTDEDDGFILSFINYYKNFRFYFNKYFSKLFEMFNCTTYSNEYFVIDTSVSELVVSASRCVKIPPRSYFIRIGGKKLIAFNENHLKHKQYIFYEARPLEIIYLREDHNIEIFVKISNDIYCLKNIEYILTSCLP